MDIRISLYSRPFHADLVRRRRHSTCRAKTFMVVGNDAPQPSRTMTATVADGKGHASRAELVLRAFFSRHPPCMSAMHRSCLEPIACAHLARSKFTIYPPPSRGVSAGVGEGHHLPLHGCGSWCSSRSTSQVPRTYEHDIHSYETLVTVRRCPALNCLPRLVLLAPTSAEPFPVPGLFLPSALTGWCALSASSRPSNASLVQIEWRQGSSRPPQRPRCS